jgi:polyketide cyclase/dehydrase/lipid transport protein
VRRITVLIIKHTVETTASPEAIWEIWQDVTNWNTWDHGIEFSTINGPFKAGTTGTIKPKGGPLVHTTLTLVEPMKMFIDEAKLPLTRIIVSHSLTESEGKTYVTHHIEMIGLLSFVFAFLIGRNMKKNLPQEMMAMVRKAESGQATSPR